LIKKLNDSCNVTFVRSTFIDVDTDFTIDVGNTLCVFRTFDGG